MLLVSITVFEKRKPSKAVLCGNPQNTDQVIITYLVQNSLQLNFTFTNVKLSRNILLIGTF